MPPPPHLKGNYRVSDKCQEVFHNSLILLFVAYSMWSMVYVSLTNENRNKLHILLSTAFAMFLLKFMFQPCKNISYRIKYNFLPSMHSKSVAIHHSNFSQAQVTWGLRPFNKLTTWTSYEQAILPSFTENCNWVLRFPQYQHQQQEQHEQVLDWPLRHPE